MKTINYMLRFLFLCIAVLLLSRCSNYLDSVYTVVLPSVPANWAAFLGQPHWRVEWINPNGEIIKKDFLPVNGPSNIKVNIPATWANPVTALPFWPQHNLYPELFKPAGALFPFDVSDGKLLLSWEAGPETVFYRELVYANDHDIKKAPANFDWLRFRELFKTGNINEEVRKDPWLVDWKSVAERTISSNFDIRRLVPEPIKYLTIPAGTGPWFGASPFADPLHTAVFPVRPGVNVWISKDRILRISGDTWKLTEIKEEALNLH